MAKNSSHLRNATPQPLPEAGARNERRLYAAGWNSARVRRYWALCVGGLRLSKSMENPGDPLSKSSRL